MRGQHDDVGFIGEVEDSGNGIVVVKHVVLGGESWAGQLSYATDLIGFHGQADRSCGGCLVGRDNGDHP